MGGLLEKIVGELNDEDKKVAEVIDLSKDADEIIQDLISKGLIKFVAGDLSNDKENI